MVIVWTHVLHVMVHVLEVVMTLVQVIAKDVVVTVDFGQLLPWNGSVMSRLPLMKIVI